MHRIAIAISTSLLLGGAAGAADLRPLAPPPMAPLAAGWTGFYLGVNVGGGIGTAGTDFSVAGGPAFASVSNPVSGAIGGGQIGYNWQAGQMVYGLETDFQASGVRGGLSTPCLPGLCGGPALTASYTEKLPWFGTVRGRLGYASAGWLLYATGGYAYARHETEATASAGGVTATLNTDDIRSGWTVGGGIEVAFAPRWTAKVEYLYLDFGNVGTTSAFAGLPAITDNSHLTLNVARAGVNYRF